MDLRKIETVLPRLRYGVTASEVLKWLENFESKDRSKLFSLLKVFEFISYNELLLRYDLLFADFLEKQVFSPKDKILIIPYGEFGKSATMMTYPLKNTESYKTRDKGSVVIENDYKKIVEYTNTNFQHVVFIDDFVGSGGTFVKECRKTIKGGKFSSLKDWFETNSFKSVALLSCIMMNDGSIYIRNELNKIIIFSDFRDQIFDSKNSPLSFYDNKDKVKNIVCKYDQDDDYNLGYMNSQAVITFFYGTPNNTLGLFWKKYKLFDRFTSDKLNKVRNLRKEIQFYASFFDKVGILDNKKYDLFDMFKKADISYFLFLAILFLKQENNPDILIISLLSITQSEFNKVVNFCFENGLLDRDSSLSLKGNSLISTIKRNKAKENFRKLNFSNLQYNQDSIIYLPKKIKGEQ